MAAFCVSEVLALSQCLCRVVQATRGARTALYCALTLTTLQHLAPHVSNIAVQGAIKQPTAAAGVDAETVKLSVQDDENDVSKNSEVAGKSDAGTGIVAVDSDQDNDDDDSDESDDNSDGYDLKIVEELNKLYTHRDQLNSVKTTPKKCVVKRTSRSGDTKNPLLEAPPSSSLPGKQGVPSNDHCKAGLTLNKTGSESKDQTAQNRNKNVSKNTTSTTTSSSTATVTGTNASSTNCSKTTTTGVPRTTVVSVANSNKQLSTTPANRNATILSSAADDAKTPASLASLPRSLNNNHHHHHHHRNNNKFYTNGMVAFRMAHHHHHNHMMAGGMHRKPFHAGGKMAPPATPRDMRSSVTY